MTVTQMSGDEKKAVRAKLRELRNYLKTWTLKAPGLHPELTVICHEHKKPTPACEPCTFVLYRAEHADQVRAEIRALVERLDGPPTPATTREATVITGRGEQLVMFV